jgi:hypothetical protein
MFVKRPNMALKSLLRTTAGSTTTNTLPTDLSIIKDEATGFLITDPLEVVKKIAELETIALSPDSILPPCAPFFWRAYVRATPTSSVSMIAGHVTPAIMRETLRRTPNHKAAGPDGVLGLVLKHMPHAFHEALHDSTSFSKHWQKRGSHPQHGFRATPYSYKKKGIRHYWTTTCP